MEISEISLKLQDIASGVLLAQPGQDMIGFELNPPRRRNCSTNKLYTYTGRSRIGAREPVNLLLTPEQYAASEVDLRKGRNLLIVRSDNMSTAIGRIHQAFADERKVELFRRGLLEAMIEERGMPELLDMATGLLGNPVVVSDAAYRLVGCSPRKPLNDGVWDSLLQHGYCEQSHVMMFDLDQTHSVLSHSDQPIYLNWGFARDMPRLSCKIGSGERIYGFMGILEYNHPFSPPDYEIASILSKAMLHILKPKVSPAEELAVLKRSLIANLLDGGVSSEDVLTRTVNGIHLRLNPPYCIAIAPLSDREYNGNMVASLCQEVSGISPNAQVLTHAGNLVVFLYGKGIEHSLKLACGLMTGKGLHVGISEPFQHLLEAKIGYRQAQVALEIGDGDKDSGEWFRYRDYAERYFIRSALQGNDPRMFASPELNAILAYDAEYESELAVTLYAYLRSYKNATATSEQMHIHRNTLSYRLRKCGEVAGIDLNNDTVCRYLQRQLDTVLG